MYSMISLLITLILIMPLVISLVKSTRFLILKKDYRSLGVEFLGFVLFICGFVYCYMRDPLGIFFPIAYLCTISIISCLIVLARHLMIKKYKVRTGMVLLAICIISFGVIL